MFTMVGLTLGRPLIMRPRPTLDRTEAEREAATERMNCASPVQFDRVGLPPEQIPAHLRAARSEDPHGPDAFAGQDELRYTRFTPMNRSDDLGRPSSKMSHDFSSPSVGLGPPLGGGSSIKPVGNHRRSSSGPRHQPLVWLPRPYRSSRSASSTSSYHLVSSWYSGWPPLLSCLTL
jgi:hypothetical protein